MVASIDTLDGPLDAAIPPMSVTVRLADELDVSRGDLICGPTDRPALARDLTADVCWMADAPLRVGGRYTFKHTTRSGRAIVDKLQYKMATDGKIVSISSDAARVGSTGEASPDAPHLHFAIENLPPTKEWWKGEPIDPFPLLVGQ